MRIPILATMTALVSLIPSASGQMPMPMPVPAPTCPAGRPSPPSEFSGFETPVTLIASGGIPGDQAILLPGKAASIALAPNGTLAFPVAPSHPGTDGTYGGVLRLTIAAPGTYRVALGAGAWLEVVRDGVAQTSIGHDHGPACSDVRKLVDFTLEPGSYLVELAGNRDPKITVMVVRRR